MQNNIWFSKFKGKAIFTNIAIKSPRKRQKVNQKHWSKQKLRRPTSGFQETLVKNKLGRIGLFNICFEPNLIFYAGINNRCLF